MTQPNVVAERVIAAPRQRVFEWLADSRNYTRSPLVLACPWVRRDDAGGFGPGAIRDVFMAAGWYREEITDIHPGHRIDYRVQRSFPPVTQEFSRVSLTDHKGGTHVNWQVDVTVRVPILGDVLTRASAPVAQRLYGTILSACARSL